MTTQILKRIATTKIPSEDWYVGVIFFIIIILKTSSLPSATLS